MNEGIIVKRVGKRGRGHLGETSKYQAHVDSVQNEHQNDARPAFGLNVREISHAHPVRHRVNRSPVITTWSVEPTVGKTPPVSVDPLGLMATTINLPQAHYKDYSTIY